MGILKGIEYPRHDFDGLVNRHRLAISKELVHRVSFYQLHDDIGNVHLGAVRGSHHLFASVIDLHDVFMI